MAARQIRPDDIDFDLIFRTTPVSFVLSIVGLLLLWMVGGLTAYHCHLVWKGMTTHEKVRNLTMPAQSNPVLYSYDRHCTMRVPPTPLARKVP